MAKDADRVSVYEVSSVEIKTNKKLPPEHIVTAMGQVRTSGYSNPELDPRVYVNPPADGIQDLDFTAKKPSGIVNEVVTPIQARKIFNNPPDWLKGYRVHSETNAIEEEV